MESFKFRKAARGVAICDFVLIALAAVALILLAVFEDSVIEELNKNVKVKSEDSHHKKDSGLDSSVFTIFLIIFAICFVIFGGIQLIAAIKLYKATDKTANVKTARGQVNFWKITTIVFFVLEIIGKLLSMDIIGLIIILGITGLRLYFGCNFLNELEAATKNPVSHLLV